jgi:hypothetical protein
MAAVTSRACRPYAAKSDGAQDPQGGAGGLGGLDDPLDLALEGGSIEDHGVLIAREQQARSSGFGMGGARL